MKPSHPVLGCLAVLLLAGCATAPRPSWAEPGLAVVGRVARVQDVRIWIGDIESEGRIVWLETGPPKEIVSFSTFNLNGCPDAKLGNDRYLVMLVSQKFGYSGEGITSENAPWAHAVACTRIDPDHASFPEWRPQP